MTAPILELRRPEGYREEPAFCPDCLRIRMVLVPEASPAMPDGFTMERACPDCRRAEGSLLPAYGNQHSGIWGRS